MFFDRAKRPLKLVHFKRFEMNVVNGFVVWASKEDEDSILTFCVPHTSPPLELEKFRAWLGTVIEAHVKDGGEKLLYATFLSAFLAQLPCIAGDTEGQRYLALSERAMRDASSSPHERSSPRQISNTSVLH